MILTDDECRKVYNDAMTLPVRNAVSVMRHIESALLEKLRGGVELPEPDAADGFSNWFREPKVLQYGAAQRLAGQAEILRALAASPQEQT